MRELFASVGLVELIVALVVLEGVFLVAYHRATGRGIAPAGVLGNLLAGLFLLLALRSVMIDAAWGWLALFLALALIAHLGDLWYRWQTETPSRLRASQRLQKRRRAAR